MSMASQKIVHKAIKDPEKIYLEPDQVLEDERLSQAEKLSILNNWHQDEEALLRADGENMTEQSAEIAAEKRDPAAMLVRIEKAQRTLSDA